MRNNHHKGWDGKRYLPEKERWDASEEVPHRTRIGCLPVYKIGKKGCGKRRRGESFVLDCAIEGGILPQAVTLGWK
jgi:hypothetical protein